MKRLILAHKRSGTLYLANLLQEYGYEVAHEYEPGHDKDGLISSVHIPLRRPAGGWNAETTMEDKPTVSYSLMPTLVETFLHPDHFDVLVHIVREPLKTIASSMTGSRRNFAWLMFKYIDYPPGEFNDTKYWAMWSWLKWNEMLEEKAEWRFKIEDLDNIWPEFCDRLDLKQAPIPKLSKRIHSKYHPDITWDELEKIDPDLTGQIKEMGKRYGYET